MIDCLAPTGLDTTPIVVVALALTIAGIGVALVLRRRSAARGGRGPRNGLGTTLGLVLVLALGLSPLTVAGSAAPAHAQAAAPARAAAPAPAQASAPVPAAPCSSPGVDTPTPAPTPQPAVLPDRDVTFDSAGVTVHASYRAPAAGRTGAPAAVIIVGTGAIDRNGTGGGFDTDVYRWLADQLSAEGIASIRYDKLGTGVTGLGPYAADPSSLLAVDYDQIRVQPARDALSFLAAQPGIDPAKLIVVGHSEGGTTALALAANPGSGPAPGALALIEPGYTHFLDIVTRQISAQVEAGVAAGLVTPADGAALDTWMTAGVAEIRTGTPPYPAPGPVPLPAAVDYTALLQSTIQSNFYGSDPTQTVVSHAYRTLYGKGVDAVDVHAIAATVTVPTLVTCGSKDFNTPCGDGTPGSGVLGLASGFAPGVAHVVQLPDMVHVLRDVGADDPAGIAAQLAYPFSTPLQTEFRAFVARFASAG